MRLFISLRILSCKFTDYVWFSIEKFKIKKLACFHENERREKKGSGRGRREGDEGGRERGKKGDSFIANHVSFIYNCVLKI